jgi:hypothetical protein
MEFVSDNHGALPVENQKNFWILSSEVRTIEPGNSQANYADYSIPILQKKQYRSEFNGWESSWNSTDIEKPLMKTIWRKKTSHHMRRV